MCHQIKGHAPLSKQNWKSNKKFLWQRGGFFPSTLFPATERLRPQHQCPGLSALDEQANKCLERTSNIWCLSSTIDTVILGQIFKMKSVLDTLTLLALCVWMSFMYSTSAFPTVISNVHSSGRSNEEKGPAYSCGQPLKENIQRGLEKAHIHATYTMR